MASSSHYPTPIPPPSSLSGFHRPGPLSRRTASSCDVRPYEVAIHHHRSASSSALSLARTRAFARPQPPITPPPPPAADHRFSGLFPSFLGSPFLTTSEPPQIELDALDLNARDGRPSSPAPTADFSIIDADAEDSDANPFIPGSYPTSTPRLISSLSFSRGRQLPTENLSRTTFLNSHGRDHPSSPIQNSTSVKSLLPRLLEVLSSPSRTILNFSPGMNTNSSSSSRSSSRTTSPSASPRRRPNQSWYTNNASVTGRHSPAYWASGPLGKSKGKAKVAGLFTSRNGSSSRKELSEHINYSDLPPLDGEEGELIDDEACFIDVRAVTGIGEPFLPLAHAITMPT